MMKVQEPRPRCKPWWIDEGLVATELKRFGESPQFPVIYDGSQPVEFQHVPGTPGYAVSSNGDVWTCRRRGELRKWLPRWNELKGWHKGPYRYVKLVRGLDTLNVPVHRIVCVTFHGPPSQEDTQVAHIDGNAANNRADNLRWASKAENEHHKQLHITAPVRLNNGRAKATEETARLAHVYRTRGWSQAKIATQLDVSQSTVSRLLSGKHWATAYHDA